MEWGEGEALPMEENYWVNWAIRFHRWGVLPCSGSAEDQPFLFWRYVDLISEFEKKMMEKEKYNKDIKRYDYIMEY